MQMTNEEIARSYRQAKEKDVQVGILAELNACKKHEIIEILIEEGELKSTSKKKPGKTEETNKKTKRKSDIEVVDYKEDKVTTESSCDENRGNGSKEETIPQSAKLTAPFTQGSQDREIGSVHIHAGNISIFISFK